MRIPSNNKIKKQVEDYANEWNRLRDDFCNGEPCICVTHPKHKEFSDNLEPLNSRRS